MQNILIVEDESVIRTALRRLLERHDYAITESGSVREACEYELDSFDLIISDLRLPGAPGTDLIKLAKTTPVLIMTSYASLRSAVDSMQKGAVDYIAKPFDHEEMMRAVKRIINDNAKPAGNTRKVVANNAHFGMIGSCPPMLTVYEYLSKVAPTNASVLIHGETGTGKERVAQAIHASSQRRDKDMISVNCAAIPESLIESELFGYEKGAFTGAQTSRIGLIEAADGSTLFLDEIGELPLEAQARLLRFIQEGEIRAIGSVHSRKVNVRLLTATHRDLKKLIAAGKFREDLYYRINVMQINVPPLRERGRDILEIAETLLENISQSMGRPGKYFSPRAIQAITTYAWPGNVREMENAIQRAVILSESDEIDNDVFNIDLELVNLNRLRDDLDDDSDDHSNPYSAAAQRSGAVTGSDPNEDLSLEDYFQRFVLEHQDRMNETELAKKLGVSRKCLWERRQRLGIPRRKSSKADKAV
ncbi:MAG TPA: sigma-54 dependent transcriptional regulator [Pseudomonadales bacterium]|nr:sigma-54 dependent transcriptional regulator [Pseudomonadales bacterium]